MKKLCIVFIIWLTLAPLYAASRLSAIKPVRKSSATRSLDHAGAVKSRVEPGMELLAIMLWLSNNYAPPLDSEYKFQVWKHFSKFRQHPAIMKMRQIQFYPDFTECGLLLTSFPAVKVNFPAQNKWNGIIGKEKVESTLNDAKIFAADTGFWKFYREHQALYDAWTQNFVQEVQEKQLLQAVDSFFRYADDRKLPQVTIYLEPLNNWGAHAIDFEKLMGEPNNSRVSFQLGPSQDKEQFPDSPLVFTASRTNIKTIWHEASHIYLSKILNINRQNIERSAGLFNAADLKSQNITTWNYAFEENLVRAVVAAITRKQFGEEAYKQEVNMQKQRGFLYTPEIAEIISTRYTADAAAYPDFDSFMPEIIRLLEVKRS